MSKPKKRHKTRKELRDARIRHRTTILEIIAKGQLGVDTLEDRNIDSLDFYDLGVASIKRALEVAYEVGYMDATIDLVR